MSKQNEYLSIKEAADFASRSTNTIRRAIKRGDLTANLVKGKYQVLVGSLVSAYGLTHAEPTQLAQELPTHAEPTQLAQELPTHDAPTQLAQELPTHDAPAQLAQELPTHDAPAQGLDVLLKLIGVLEKELEAKDEQLRAKDQQIAQLISVTMELAKQSPPSPTLESSLEPTPEPTPEGKGFWATVRKRFS